METKYSYLIPLAILVAGAVLSFAVYTVRIHANAPIKPVGDVTLVRPVDITDHVLGSPTAAVTVVEYSDIDCEYCKQQQQVMEQVMADYGPSGKVAWVYRHFPIVDAHPNSGNHAEAAECVAEEGGPQAFWQFIDALNASASGATQFDPADYDKVVVSLGLSAQTFEACRTSDKFLKKVSGDFENALAIGADRAPYSVLLIQGASPMTISGSIPYDTMKQAIESALSKAVPQ